MQDFSKVKPRVALASDHETLVHFNMSLAFESEDLQLDREILSAGVKAVLDDANKGRYLILEVEGQIIASVMITEEWSDWRNGNVAWIQSLYVIKECRGQGAFRAIYDFLQDECRNGTYRGIRLYADKANRSAVNIYRKMGMDDSHYLFFEKMN